MCDGGEKTALEKYVKPETFEFELKTKSEKSRIILPRTCTTKYTQEKERKENGEKKYIAKFITQKRNGLTIPKDVPKL